MISRGRRLYATVYRLRLMEARIGAQASVYPAFPCSSPGTHVRRLSSGSRGTNYGYFPTRWSIRRIEDDDDWLAATA